jgi:hypothetical protein
VYTPVFIDDLPDISTIADRKSEVYRLGRNRALTDLLLDESVTWEKRTCPGCGANGQRGRNFTQSPIAFLRCGECNTIYCARMPDHKPLDRMRKTLGTEARMQVPGDAEDDPRKFEYISILNWIRLNEARADRPVQKIVDYRFSSQAPGFPAAVKRYGRDRDWTFLPLDPSDGKPFEDLGTVLREKSPDAVLLYGEMDRIAEPAALLKMIRENVLPGTLVFVNASCADGLEYEILGPESPSFVPLDRLNVFSLRGFGTLARSCGYKTVETSTPGRLDAIILQRYFTEIESSDVPFWSGFFRNANKDRLRDLQILLQRSLRSGVMRFVLET